MTGTAGLPTAYRDALRAACAAALDAGVFYDTDLDAFVVPRIARSDPARDLFLGVFEEPAEFVARSAWNEDLDARIAASARGTWLLRRRSTHLGDRDWFVPLMSDGSGARHWNADSYDIPPDYMAVYRRMAGYEIYLMRREIEAERSRARNIALIAARGFQPGSTFRNLRIGGDRYSTVTITALHPPPEPNVTIVGADDRGEGWLTLALTKRGSRHRYRTNIAAGTLASAIDEAATARGRGVEAERGALLPLG